MKNFKISQKSISPYLNGLGIIALFTLLSGIIHKIVAAYLFMVVIASLRLGKGPAIMVSVLGALALDFFIVPPPLKFTANVYKYMLSFASVLVAGLVINTLVSQIKRQTEEAQESEARTALLYRLSKDLAAADSLDSVINAIRADIAKIFNCESVIFLPVDNKLKIVSFDEGFPVTEQQKGLVDLVFESGEPAESGTGMYAGPVVHYVPLKTVQGLLGVLGVSFKKGRKAMALKEKDLLSALASQAAIALQRSKLAEISRQLELVHEREKLQVTLLNSISHELRTPLVSIKGALSSLLEDTSTLNANLRKELVAAAYEDSEYLNQLLGNLLDMTRLEAGALKLHIKPCELRDVIGAALQSFKSKLEGRTIDINVPQDLPEVPLDFVLMMRVLINLADNAIKYSSFEAPVEISAVLKDREVQIDIKDHGTGIPPEDLEHIFDKFYRASETRPIPGTGLGLSICKGFVEAHRGRIWARNNEGQGATISVVLPLERDGF